MDVEIAVPRRAVDVAPGDQVRVPLELTNRSADDVWVRLTLARSRAGAWITLEPQTVSVAGDTTLTIDAVVRPPATAAVTSALLPFTVQVEDVRDGTPLARATGLVTLTAPERLRATLRRTSTGRRVHLTLTLGNPSDERRRVTLTPQLQPNGGKVLVEPTTVELAPGGTANAHVEVRPPAMVVGAAVPYVISVSCHDAATGGAGPVLAVAEETGQSPPRLSRGAAVGLTAALILAAGATVLTGGIDLPGRTGSPPASNSDEIRIRNPYAQVEVFPGGNGEGRAAAEAALARLTAAGMPVRLVDSRLSPDLADGQSGLFVLLQDGFAGVDEVVAYCERYREIAPKCAVVP